MYPHIWVAWNIGMEIKPQATQELRPYKTSIDIGHSKSGSDHVLIIKSMKVHSDDPVETLQIVEAMLKRLDAIIAGDE
tara:strand:- start:215 stop:448 length:234 start_codon:yes stop_codon:yes gene_type:complete